jgi:SAM-dependent methyltransferase
MNPGEHEVMSRVESGHWWYRGLRDVLSSVLVRPAFSLRPSPSILDAGCGTGANLQMLAGLLQPGYFGGFDLSEEALRLAREKVRDADLYRSDICDPALHRADLDLIISMDAIYIPGTERSLPGLRRMVEALRPGGLLILNLPAYEWLYSEHDVAVHTSHRYTAREVRKLFEDLGLTTEILSYRLFFLLPVVVAARLPSLLGRRRTDRETKSDLHSQPGSLISAGLLASLRLENRMIVRGIPLPWGSSVFGVARKR